MRFHPQFHVAIDCCTYTNRCFAHSYMYHREMLSIGCEKAGETVHVKAAETVHNNGRNRTCKFRSMNNSPLLLDNAISQSNNRFILINTARAWVSAFRPRRLLQPSAPAAFFSRQLSRTTSLHGSVTFFAIRRCSNLSLRRATAVSPMNCE